MAGDASRLARFVREARTASALNHPNVVSIYEIGREMVGGEEVHYIAMEKVDGKNLRSTLNGSRLPDFKDLRAYFWDFTPDGRFAIVERASIARDAVVITRFR